MIASYYYDPFGRRLWKEVSGVRTYFCYADEGLIGEYDSTGNEIKTYGYKPGSTWTTDPLFMKEGSSYYFYQNDHLGTPQKITAVNGAVVWSAKYSSFGKADIYAASTMTSNLRFPGQYFDAETGLYYNYFRYYNPKLGRYVKADLIGILGGINRFSYVGNNSLNWIDPWGLFTLADAKNGLRKRGIAPDNKGFIDSYSDTQIFDEWLRLEKSNTKWIKELTPCPKKITVCDEKGKNPDDSVWKDPTDANPEHAGAVYEMRSQPTAGGHANQCSYDANGNIMTGIPAGGTADYVSHGLNTGHFNHDLRPWWLAKKLKRRADYYNVRPEVIEK